MGLAVSRVAARGGPCPATPAGTRRTQGPKTWARWLPRHMLPVDAHETWSCCAREDGAGIWSVPGVRFDSFEYAAPAVRAKSEAGAPNARRELAITESRDVATRLPGKADKSGRCACTRGSRRHHTRL